VKYPWNVKKEGLHNGRWNLRKNLGPPPPLFLTTFHGHKALRHFLHAEAFSNCQDNNNENELEMDQEQRFLLGCLQLLLEFESLHTNQRKILVLSCSWKVDQRPLTISFPFGATAALTLCNAIAPIYSRNGG
jgi:hypothetical protein